MKKTVLLIAIPILVAVLYIMNLLITTNNQNRMIKKFNLQYEYYLNKTIYGTDLATVINKAVNENEKNNVKKDEKNFYIENNENSIKINVIIEGNTYSMEKIYYKDITRFVENFNIAKFKCINIGYHEKTGRVKELTFEEVVE